MRNAILLSQDLTKGRRCSMAMARQLLQQGLARIIRFYPYTLQLKNTLGPDNQASHEDDSLVPYSPADNPPSWVKRLALRVSNTSKNHFKIYQPVPKSKKPLIAAARSTLKMNILTPANKVY